jgi:hypothetical protein
MTFCCATGDCERCRVWRAHEAEIRAAWLSFLKEHDLTPEQVAEARARAEAKIREVRSKRWHTVIVENPGPRHHLTDATPDPVARGLEAFLARYTDDDLGAMLVDLVVHMRKQAALQRFVMSPPKGTTDEILEAGYLLEAKLDEQAKQWRADLEATRRQACETS